MIHNEEEYDAALATAERLLFSKARTEAEEEMFIPLVLDIEGYEAVHYPMDPSTPHESLQHIMEHSGVSRENLASILEVSVNELEAILKGDVLLTEGQATALGNYFVVNPELFIPLL
jgi:HTH-type transcriptional regulator/antitoxin HigA